MQKIVFDRIRAAEHRDPQGAVEARSLLETAYRWLDGAMAGRKWAAGDTFSLADCAAAPALFWWTRRAHIVHFFHSARRIVTER
jgi:glutathione S-transferase